jgi:hypothetical protein
MSKTYAELPNERVSGANGVDYAYRDTGGEKTPLVSLQHFRGNLDSWDPALAGGHVGRLGTRADGELQIAYMADLLAGTRATIASLDRAPFFKQYGNNGWAIFQAYYNAAAVQAAGPVVGKYLGQLAAVDVFTYDNATLMFESLRVDYADLGPFGDHP